MPGPERYSLGAGVADTTSMAVSRSGGSCRPPWDNGRSSCTSPLVCRLAGGGADMCQKLAELERAMGAFAAGFEPALVSAAQAEGVMERAARIEHMAATIKALAAARMAETDR